MGGGGNISYTDREKSEIQEPVAALFHGHQE